MSNQAEKLIDFRGRSVSFRWDIHLGQTLMGKEKAARRPQHAALHPESSALWMVWLPPSAVLGLQVWDDVSTLAFPEVKQRMTLLLSSLSFVSLKGSGRDIEERKCLGGGHLRGLGKEADNAP